MEVLRSSLAAAANSIVLNNTTFGYELGSFFDYSIVFDHALFTELPNILMIGACPIYIFWYHDQPFVTSKKSLLIVKLVCSYMSSITICNC